MRLLRSGIPFFLTVVVVCIGADVFLFDGLLMTMRIVGIFRKDFYTLSAAI